MDLGSGKLIEKLDIKSRITRGC